jgi:hypothetical protein
MKFTNPDVRGPFLAIILVARTGASRIAKRMRVEQAKDGVTAA